MRATGTPASFARRAKPSTNSSKGRLRSPESASQPARDSVAIAANRKPPPIVCNSTPAWCRDGSLSDEVGEPQRFVRPAADTLFAGVRRMRRNPGQGGRKLAKESRVLRAARGGRGGGRGVRRGGREGLGRHSVGHRLLPFGGAGGHGRPPRVSPVHSYNLRLSSGSVTQFAHRTRINPKTHYYRSCRLLLWQIPRTRLYH